MRTRPVLFLDVDGPLIPFGASSRDRPGGYKTFTAATLLPPGASPLLSRVDPSLGPSLLALDCDMVWATTWMHQANDVVAPLLGLAPLPVLDWPEPDEQSDVDARRGLHWKTRALVDWASSRDFVWIDDEITAADERYVAAQHRGVALLVRVEAKAGITAGDLDRVRSWRTGRG